MPLEYPAECFVFSVPHKNRFVKDANPGSQPFGNGFFSKRFARIRKKLELSSDFTLYGFKHTRIIHLKTDGVQDGDIMNLTGHLNFESYSKYLRDLGLSANPDTINQKTRKF